MDTKKDYSIIIVDDHEIVRSGIKLVLKSQKDLIIKDEASSYNELMEKLEKSHFDILILDLNLGDKNGIHQIRKITDLYPSLAILILSMYPEDPYALQTIQEGALGYLSKKSMADELIIALQFLKEKKVYLNPEYLETLPYGTILSKKTKSSIDSLSQREFEVYTLITSGLSFKEIALKLDISPKTVSTYRARILEKLSLSTTNQLIHFAMQESVRE